LLALVVLLSMLGAAAAAGPLVGATTAMVLATVFLLWRSELRCRRKNLDLADMLATLRTLVREIRSGAQPLAAIEASAKEHPGRCATALNELAIWVAIDGAPTAQAAVRGDISDAEIGARLRQGWLLSRKYGVPWASLIDALTTDIADRVSANSERSAQVSGPRMSGFVLAAMPVLGLLLGAGMGADPLRVLFATQVGQLLLLVGSSLTCAGLAWVARIVRG